MLTWNWPSLLCWELWLFRRIIQKQLAVLISLVPTLVSFEKHTGCGLEFCFCSKKGPFLSSLVDISEEALATPLPGFFQASFCFLPPSRAPSMALHLALHPTVPWSKLCCMCEDLVKVGYWGSHFLVGQAAAWMLGFVQFISAHQPLFAFPIISLLPD